jgi:hypothetical protein
MVLLRGRAGEDLGQLAAPEQRQIRWNRLVPSDLAKLLYPIMFQGTTFRSIGSNRSERALGQRWRFG